MRTAEEIVEAHDRAVDHMQRSELRGSLRLGCNGEVAQSGLYELTSRFGRIHPDGDLAIRVRNSRILHEMLDNGDGMRPWGGISATDLPQVAFILRSRPDAEGNELIAALRTALTETLKPSLS